ncbi:MAG: carbohydrate binding family 9 domain-containing protein [Balneolaceae bacterium]|nr:carbohydrate binding family 9 domain-containing protein [Balneolaceae bacterium]
MTILFAIALSLMIQSVAQSINEPMILTRITGPIVIDGHVDEPAWDLIDPVPLVSYDPVSGLPPSEPTEIRIGYDDQYIYASIRAYDSNPSGIRANTLYRDRLSGDDVFHILLDTYNDNESAMAFTITPTGAKRDATVSNDGEGPRAMNADFTTYWDVATQITDEGWFAEVRIPFSSLGFQDDKGRVEMGLLFQRGIARKNERVTFPEVPANVSRPFFKPSLGQRIVFEGIYSSRPLHITPYILGGLEQNYHLNETQSGFSRNDDTTLEAGFDIKYGITNNLTLDLTVNTDFAQVEADDQQVNLTRFNLFFPEKRQFFQERSGIFEFNTGDNGRLFHSRRIGLSPTGEQVRIIGGGRLTGRVGSWDIGLLNMQTGRYEDIDTENFGVLRLRRELFNPYSFAGAMATSRINTEGYYNIGLGMDGNIRFRGDDYFSYVWAFTMDEQIGGNSITDASKVRINMERRTRRGFSYETTVGYSGETYNPGTGFVPRNNYYMAEQNLRYGWLPGSASPLLWHSFSVESEGYWNASTNRPETVELGSTWEATTKPGASFDASVTWFYEDVPFDFPLLQSTNITEGTYRFTRASIGYRMASSRLFRTRFQLDAGTFYNGNLITATIAPTWNVSRHLELEASYLYNLLDAGLDEDWFSVHVGQLRIRTAVNTRLSTNAFIQFNSAANIAATNVRFRYNFRDGNDFWIVFNQGMNTERNRFELALPRTNARTVMVKYTHTFHR